MAANATASTLEGFGTLVGPALGGVLIATAGASVGFAAASACCLVSFGLLMALRVEGGALRAAAPGRSLGDVLAGFRTVASSNNPRLIVVLFAAQTFVRGALSVLIVVVALDLLALGQSWVGFLMAAIGAGGVVGALAATGLAGRPMAVPLLFGLVLWGAPIATIGAFPSAAVALLACMTIGAGNAIIDVAGNTLLQRVVPNEVLGRVFGAFVGLTLVAVGLGSIVTPAVIDALGTRGALVVTGALLPLVALIAGARVRAIDRDAAPPERELGFVRGVPMLAALSVACAEQIASRLSLVPIAAGRAIISEGETGNYFYIVESGELEVRQKGRVVAVCDPGDYIGEIALLRDVPRTATVTARCDSRVYALDRAAFIEAVTGHPEGVAAGDVVVGERLAVR